MRINKTTERTCIFCGETRSFTSWSDDGRDFYGHSRGKSSRGDDDTGCNCELGKIEHNVRRNKMKIIKPMCLNCASFSYGYCKNKKTLESISKMFEIKTDVKIKKPTKKCDNHRFSMEVLERMLGVEIEDE